MASERVLVCGGREYDDRDAVFRVLDAIHARVGIECIIHGAARGADRLAGEWAYQRRIACNSYPADWRNHRNAAGPIRNLLMLKEGRPTLVVAFQGGKGTAHMVDIAKKANIPTIRGGGDE